MSQLFFLPFQPIPNQRGLPAGSAKAYFYQSGTTTLQTVYADAGLTVPLRNPVVADAIGRLPDIYMPDTATYRVRLVDRLGSPLGDDIDPYVPGTMGGPPGPPGEGLADVMAPDGSNKVGFLQAGAGAVPRTTRDKVRERVSVSDYRQAGDADDTAAFKRARDYCQQTGKTLWVPAGSYTISDTISVSGSFDIRGEGAERSLITMVSATVKPMFDVSPPNNVVVLGMWLSGLQLRCSGGSAVCDGVIVRSAPVNSTIRQCQFDNLWIRDCRRGFSLQGVIYRNFITNITVQGTTDHGFYCDAGFVDVTYNTFAQLEVTNVADGAHAYYLHSNNSLFDMLTSDGVAYFSSPGGVLRNYKLETIQANSFPVSVGPACVLLNQMQIVDAASCIGVSPSKRSYFLRIVGTSTSIRGTRFTSPQPINPYFFEDGSGGTVDGTYMEGTRGTDKRFVEDAHTDEILNRWLFSACDDITKRSARRQQGTWTPNFSAEWTTPPSGVAGTWRRSGDKVLYIATGTGGVCTAGAAIGGLPQMDGAPMHNTRGNGQLVSPTQASPCLITSPSETTLRSFRALNIPAADEWTLVVEAGA